MEIGCYMVNGVNMTSCVLNVCLSSPVLVGPLHLSIIGSPEKLQTCCGSSRSLTFIKHGRLNGEENPNLSAHMETIQ